MRNFALNRTLALFPLLMLFLLFCADRPRVAGQPLGDTRRLDELRRLRDELRLTESLRNQDVVVIVGERSILEAARLLVGFEIMMANGGVLRVTGVNGELKPAAAIVKLDVQAKSSTTVNLTLTGRLGTGEIQNGSLQLPFQITEIALTDSPVSSFLIKSLLGDWLSPKRWNEELPPLKIPMEIGKSLQFPAGRFNVEGSPAMEISTPGYELQLRFVLTSLFVLDRRLVIGLQMTPNSRLNETFVPASFIGSNDANPAESAALENELARLGESLVCRSDLLVRLNRRVISGILTQIAAAHQNDFIIQLKPGRLREEQVEAIVKTTNYTDVEGGNGIADVSQLSIENIVDGKLNLKLSGQGNVDANLKGREYGVPYRLSPRTTFSIKDQIVPLELTSDGDRPVLRATPGTRLPIDLRFSVKLAGREVGINRNVALQTDRWLNRIELPSFFGSEFSLPRKLEVGAGDRPSVATMEKIGVKLSKARMTTNNDAIEMSAELLFQRLQ